VVVVQVLLLWQVLLPVAVVGVEVLLMELLM
jgi:hypothetical protein